MFRRIREDLDTAIAKDPSARNRIEVALAFPGVHAVWGHRISHRLWRSGLKLLARVYSNSIRT
ncbi:MAG: serine O-acetyltransferase, partial [Actinomycetales bacterium]